MDENKYEEILSLPPFKFMEYIQANFTVKSPTGFNTLQEVAGIANLLIEIVDKEEALSGFAAYAKLKSRELKRNGDKIGYEDMVDRREVIECTLGSLKDKYNAISRGVTIVLNTEKHY